MFRSLDSITYKPDNYKPLQLVDFNQLIKSVISISPSTAGSSISPVGSQTSQPISDGVSSKDIKITPVWSFDSQEAGDAFVSLLTEELMNYPIGMITHYHAYDGIDAGLADVYAGSITSINPVSFTPDSVVNGVVYRCIEIGMTLSRLIGDSLPTVDLLMAGNTTVSEGDPVVSIRPDGNGGYYFDFALPAVGVGGDVTLAGDNAFTGANSFSGATTLSDTTVTAGSTLEILGSLKMAGQSGQVLAIGANGNVITKSEYSYTLPASSSSMRGGVKIGSNISVSGDVISVPLGSASIAGVVKAGDNLSVSSGVISVPTASGSAFGVVRAGTGCEIVNGVLNITMAGGDVYLANDNAFTGANTFNGNVTISTGKRLTIDGYLDVKSYSLKLTDATSATDVGKIFTVGSNGSLTLVPKSQIAGGDVYKGEANVYTGINRYDADIIAKNGFNVWTNTALQPCLYLSYGGSGDKMFNLVSVDRRTSINILQIGDTDTSTSYVVDHIRLLNNTKIGTAGDDVCLELQDVGRLRTNNRYALIGGTSYDCSNKILGFDATGKQLIPKDPSQQPDADPSTKGVACLYNNIGNGTYTDGPVHVAGLVTELNKKLNVDCSNTTATSKEYMANMAMPDNANVVNITNIYDGMSILASSNGYVSVTFKSSVDVAGVSLVNGSVIQNIAVSRANVNMELFMPVAKGDTVKVWMYGIDSASKVVKFIRAKGL